MRKTAVAFLVLVAATMGSTLPASAGPLCVVTNLGTNCDVPLPGLHLTVTATASHVSIAGGQDMGASFGTTGVIVDPFNLIARLYIDGGERAKVDIDTPLVLCGTSGILASGHVSGNPTGYTGTNFSVCFTQATVTPIVLGTPVPTTGVIIELMVPPVVRVYAAGMCRRFGVNDLGTMC